MRKIDLYIIRKFLVTFFFAIGLLIIVVIIFDISEKLDDFLDKGAPLKAIVFQYYLNFIPYFINLFSPLFTFIAVVFFTAKMASDTEIVAILSSGVSFRRMLLPYMISAFILTVMTWYLGNFVIPHANKARMNFETNYINKHTNSRGRNIHIQLGTGEMIYIEFFNSNMNLGTNFTLEKFNNTGLFYKMHAENIVYDTIKGTWQVNKMHQRWIAGLDEHLEYSEKIDTIFPFTPENFKTNVVNVDVMGYSKLRDFIQEEIKQGSENLKIYQVEKHKRFAFPFATIILTLIGVSLSSRKVRGGIGLHLAIGIIISFAYILFMQISTSFASHGDLSPLLAVWIPNLIFAAIGFYLLRIAPK